MGKTDISTAILLPWDKYKSKPIDEALQTIYEHASGTSTKISGWYWTSIKTKRNTSLCVRLVTFLLLAFGTILPILAGLGNDPESRLQFTQYGVVALALAGLLQLADRIFGWSSGWLRYITTVTAMESLTRKFELDWAEYILNRMGALTESDTKQLFDMAKHFEDGMVKLQSDETDKWVLEFNSGIALLNDLIKSQRESGEKAVEAAHAAVTAQQAAVAANEKSKQGGAIEVTLIHKAEVKPVSISIEGNVQEEFLGTVWSRLNLSPGQHIINIATIGDTPRIIKKVVEIPAGGVARVEVKIE
jgi:hypothetical protein